jgi:hypothetical protein
VCEVYKFLGLNQQGISLSDKHLGSYGSRDTLQDIKNNVISCCVWWPQLLQAALPMVKQSAITQIGAAVLITPRIIRVITIIQDALVGI